MNSNLEKCPNCFGNLKSEKNGRKMVCPYCDSEFVLYNDTPDFESTASDKNNTGLSLSEQLFITNFKVENMSEKSVLAWKNLCYYIDRNYSIDDYLSDLKTVSSNNNFMAMPNVNTELFGIIKNKVYKYFESGEKMLFYKDGGIIFKGKEGMLITDKSVYSIKKEKVIKQPLSEVKSLYNYINFGSSWYLNNIRSNCIDILNCSDEDLGLILALICTMVRDLNPVGFKIKTYQEYTFK